MIIGGVSAGVVYLWKNRTHNNEIMELKNNFDKKIMDLEQKIRKEVRVELQEHVAVKIDQLEFHVDKKIFENQTTILEQVKKEIANVLRDFMNDERLGA